MKKILAIVLSIILLTALVIPAAAADNLEELSNQFVAMKPAMFLLCAIITVLTICCVVFTIMYLVNKKHNGGKSPYGPLLIVLYITTVLVLLCTLVCFFRYLQVNQILLEAHSTPPATQPVTLPAADPSLTVPPTTQPPTEPPTVPDPTYTPEFVELSDPENWAIHNEVSVDGKIVEDFQREEPISFGTPEDYFPFEGISTFRGNNYRNDAAFGTASITEETISKVWTRNIGSLNSWPGSGWTGQPLVVRWDQETKTHMNLYEDKKAKADLVEVIHATLDGYVYFYDLEDGSYTRDPINLGMNFKGAGCLDPRGYPVMYVGSGITLNGTVPKMYVVSLIDGSILYTKGGYDSFAPRSWTAYDSTPLVSGETDTLIWPGENGVLYTIKLNTVYDKTAGTLSVTPDEPVRMRYTTADSRSGKRWVGYESSAVAVGQYLYVSENGGMFFCIDLNTMKIVWAQDTKDDSNSTPIFRWEEDGNGYLYTAPSLHWTQSNSRGQISIYKLNAATGEIVWEVPFDCHTIPDLSGGVQGSPMLGREGTELENMIIYPIARTDGFYDGHLIALDATTGEVIWKTYMTAYTWSSPVGVYTEDGKGYIVMCDSAGNVALMNGKTGEILNHINLGSNIEASPIVFEDTIVIGTRGSRVCGLKIS